MKWVSVVLQDKAVRAVSVRGGQRGQRAEQSEGVTCGHLGVGVPGIGKEQSKKSLGWRRELRESVNDCGQIGWGWTKNAGPRGGVWGFHSAQSGEPRRI